MNRGREAAERFAERRRREDSAPRLHDVVPTLTSCTLLLEDARAEAVSAEVSYTRRIVVEHAPALFVVPCSDPSCKDGGHDVTTPIMMGLKGRQTEIVGTDTCYGHTGTAPCGRNLTFRVKATYGH